MKYVFLTGWQRSGTTLLTRMFNAHSRIIFHYQPYTDYFEKIVNKTLSIVNIKNNFYSFSEKVDEVKTFLMSSLDSIFFDEIELKTLKENIRTSLKDNYESAPFVLDYLDSVHPGTFLNIFEQLMVILSKAYAKPNLSYVGIKELYCEDFIEIFSNYMKNYFYGIHLIRDPRAVFASRNYGKYMQNHGVKKYPIMFVIKNWKKSVNFYFDFKNNANYQMILYENLIKDTETEIKKLFNLLGENFESQILNPNYWKNGIDKTWYGNSSFGNNKKFNTLLIDKWKKVLSDAEINIIEYFCNPELEKLGYEIANDSFKADILYSYTEKRDDIVEWLSDSFYVLTTENKKNYINC